ncbi:MAG: four helix bundle protein [Hyphomicrobiales bacterium]|nr:MAG: four helix bundle protein [Hyphomicrobiales bacterium]
MADRGIQSYRDLVVWQKAIALSVACYQLTANFPKEEIYGLTAQIRRSSVSIAANIAEGHGREHTRSFVQFLRTSQGSLKELETHLIISEKVRLISQAQLDEQLSAADELGRMLRALIRSLQNKLEEVE